jgi:hypothetical protein
LLGLGPGLLKVGVQSLVVAGQFIDPFDEGLVGELVELVAEVEGLGG